jgi:hypothetical protein
MKKNSKIVKKKKKTIHFHLQFVFIRVQSKKIKQILKNHKMLNHRYLIEIE